MKNYKINSKFSINFEEYNETNIFDFADKISDYIKNTLHCETNCIVKRKEYIEIVIFSEDNKINLKFILNETLFNNCYEFDGKYTALKFVNTRKIIRSIFNEIFDTQVIVTKKELVRCENCGEPLGWIYNDDDVDYAPDDIARYHSDNLKILDRLYESDVCECSDCNKWFCYDCLNHFDEWTPCDSCLDNFKSENNLDDDDDDWLNWTTCKYDEYDEKYQECENCEHRDECISNAEDARSGYAMFEDSIVDGGYDSMDDFWECNGI